MSEVKYVPILKGKGFCPNPVVKLGIPYFADSITNPKCEGSLAHAEWWNEQFDRCLNGYSTGGIVIPGRYYFYLNFCKIMTVGRGKHYPEFVDFDYEYFKTVDEAKKNHKGIIFLKARRRGASEKWSNGIANYGLRFTPEGYRAGIAAGRADYADNLFNKIKQQNAWISPELKLHYLYDNKEFYQLGYNTTDSKGIEQTDGSLNTVLCQTMNKNPNVLKSNYFNDVAFEEAGEFEFLVKGYNATKDAFAVGDKMIGTPYIFGTGGDIKNQSKGFQEMWHNSDSYNLIKIRCHAPRLYIECFIGSKTVEGKVIDDCPNIFKRYPEASYEQLIGMEDTERATERILNRKMELEKLPDKKQLYDFMQNNPLNDDDAFLSFSGNPWDHIILGKQLNAILNYNGNPYDRYVLEWKKDDNGIILFPLQVEAKLAPNNVEDHDAILIRYHPRLNIKNIDVAGIDSYDVDSADTSKSLGAMVIVRDDYNNISEEERLAPCCLIRQRPKRKEVFYENCLKAAVYYGLSYNSQEGDVLIDYAKPAIIEWFKKNGGKRFLAKRPLSFESEDSEQRQDYGVLLTNSPKSKPQAVGKLQSYIIDNGHKIWFPQIIVDTQRYDISAKDSDSDSTDALMIALIRLADRKNKPRILSENNNDPFSIYKTGDANPNNNKLIKDLNGNLHYNPFHNFGIKDDRGDPFAY